VALTEEERTYLYALDKLAPGQLTDMERAYLDDIPPTPVPEPTTGEKAKHIASRWATGLMEPLNIPRMVVSGQQMVGDFAAENFPRATEFLNKNPVGQAMGVAFDANPINIGMGAFDDFMGNRPATDVIPGVRQAYQTAQDNSLSPEQLEGSPFTRATGVGAEWVGLPGVSAGSRAVSGGVKMLPEALALLRRELGMATSTAAGAGAASEAGRWAFDSETGGDVGELIGGATATVLGARRGRGVLTDSQRDMLNALRERMSPEDFAKVQEMVDKGEIGTLLDATGNRKLADVEAALDRTTQGSEALDRTLSDRVNQIYEDTTSALRRSAPEDADPNYATREAANIVAGRERGINADAAVSRGQEIAANAKASDKLSRERGQAVQAMEQRQGLARAADAEFAAARQNADPGVTTVDASQKTDTWLNLDKQKFNETEVRPKWAAFEAGTVDTPSVQIDQEAFITSLRPKQMEDLEAAYPSLLEDMRGLDANATPADVQGVISDMKNAAYADNPKNERAQRLLRELYAKLETNLAATNPAYRDAVAATKRMYDRFGGRIGDATGADMPEVAISRLGTSGDQGAATVRQIENAGSPNASRGLYDYVLAEATRRGENISQEFLDQYQGAIDRMPAADQLKLQRLVEAKSGREGALTQARAAQEEAERVNIRVEGEQNALANALDNELKGIDDTARGLREANRSSILADYGKGGAEADRVVEGVLTRPDGVERLRALRDDLLEADQAQGMGQKVMPSFQARVNEQVRQKLFNVFTDSKEPVADALANFRKMRGRLVDEQLMDAADADFIDELLTRMETASLRTKAKATLGDVAGPNTVDSAILSSLMASGVLGPLPGAYNLQLGGAVRRYFKTGLEVPPTRRNILALTEYVTNPAEFLKGIEKLDSPAAKTQFFLTKLVGAAQAAEIMAADEE
jgi:hypothetical protein